MSEESRLTFVHDAPPRHGQSMAWYECLCGTLKLIRKAHVTSGATKSCGCYRDEMTRKNTRTHGLSHLPEYRLFMGIKNRCENTHDTVNYAKYGARGIRCLWLSFEAFYADMGPRPTPHHTIDRLDNAGDYCKANCRWATPRQQALNKSTNHYLTLWGHRQTLAEWSKATGINHSTLLQRKRLGWTDEEALTIHTDLHKRPKHLLTLRGRVQTLSAWSKETGISHVTILQRKRLGWSDEEALTIPPSLYTHSATRRKRPKQHT